MKKHIAILFALSCLSALAQVTNVDLTTTNTVSGVTFIGDELPIAFAKLNYNDNYIWTNRGFYPSNTWSLTIVTNGMSEGSAKFAMSNNVPVVVTLSGGIVGVFNLTNSATIFKTNTIAAYTFSNSILSSKEFIQYSTNYAYWNRVSGGSNYLGRFQGMTRWQAYGGNDGGNPPGDIPVTLFGSYSGTNAWFAITNGQFFTTNFISLAIRTNGNSFSGGTIVNPGMATIYNIDHPELYGVTNSLDYQKIKLNTPPSEANDLANKGYVDMMFANAFDGNFSRFDSNGVNHFVYSYQNRVVFDITSSTTWVPLKGSSLDGPMTHILVDVYQTNLTAGYDFQSSTNLALTAGFTTFTNYTLSTNSGVVTFTVPINIAESARFFRIVSSIASGAAFNVPLSLNGGTIYPSNTWSFATITNTLPNFGFWQGSSNGQALVTLWRSNASVYYVVRSNAVDLKILAP